MLDKHNIQKATKDEPQLNIGEWLLDCPSATLRSGEKELKLEPLPFEFLCYLIKHPGQVISREELLKSVWDNRVVSDDAIRRVVKKLREALGDDAKSPRYIKTIPLKGYSLIAPISPVKPPADIHKQASSNKRRLGLATLVTMVLIVIAIALPKGEPQATDVTSPQVTPLTHLSGSELNGSYNARLNTLMFSFRNNNNEPFQLYTKDLNNQQVKRLTWDGAAYYNGILSPDGHKLAYYRQDQQGYDSWLADYDPRQGMSNAQNLSKTEFPSNLIAWSNDSQSLYFNSDPEDESTAAIFRLSLGDRQWQQLTFPNLQGYGDFKAKESPDGRFLAVLRNVVDRRYALLILDLKTRDLLVEQPLPFFPSELVWQTSSQQLAISSFKGDFYYYSMLTDSLTEQPGSKPGLNDVFFTCGERCFYMRQHKMNYMDIKEIPNPFSKQKNIATVHIESDKAEFNPIYNHQGDTLFFTSKDDSEGRLIRQKVGQPKEIIHRFNPRHVLAFLSMNAQGTHLAGKLEDRNFIFDLSSNEFKFITTAMESVGYPSWEPEGEAVVFSRIEKSRPVLLMYDATTDRLTRLDTGIQFQRKLADGRHFIVDEKKDLYQQMPDNSRRFIVKLPYVRPDYWTIHNNHLYFSQLKGQDSYLTRQELDSGEQQQHLMAKSSYRLDFNIHPEGHKLLITQSLLADSNLVKVEWQN